MALTELCLCRYPQSRILEINSHSLFSRWFSESGKLVQRLFTSINALVDEEDTFIVVLIGVEFLWQGVLLLTTASIDEVESLTASRAAVMAGTEPSDGLRVSDYLEDVKPSAELTLQAFRS